MILRNFFGPAVLLLLVALPAFAQTPAFPGALGFGAYATGGRNGTIYHVTTLADSGAGSFRSGVASGNRTIVFDVGGEIKLLTAVSCSSSLTIAGQTAPGGIVFNGGEISFANRNNIICRYIRIRPGSDTESTGDDALSFYRASNIIMDHTSIAFAPWNNIDGVGDSTHLVTDISIQNSINANPTGQQFGCHAESVGGQWSWQYNIFANSHNRNPLAKVNDTFINNLEYNNSAGYTTHTSTKFKHDIVNNYFIWGPASGGNFPWYQMDNNQSIYFTGNLSDATKDGVLGGSATVPLPGYQGGGTILNAPWSSWTTIIPTMTPALAYRYNVSAAGAWPRDEVDSLLISQIKTLGTGGPGGGLYTSQTQTGLGNNGYGTLTGLTAPTDTDNDGMPDYWELATGSATNSYNTLTNTATGYTLLENYLNYLAAPHAVTRTNTPVDLNLSQFVAGFAASATFSLTNATNGTVSLLNGTNAHFVPNANFSGIGMFDFKVTEGSFALSATVTICVTPLTPPASAIAFNGALIAPATNAAATTVSLPANLLWRGDGAVNAWNTTSSNWFNGAGRAAFKSGDVVTFDDTGSNTPAIPLSGALTPGAILFSHTKNYTIAGNGLWNGSGSFTKTGSGSLTIGTTNSLGGSINIRDGLVTFLSGANPGGGAITLAGGGTFEVQGGAGGSTITGPITVAPGETATISSGQLATSFNGAIATSSTSSLLNVSNGVSFGGTPTSQFSGYLGTVRIVPSATLRFSSAANGITFGALVPSFVVDGTMKPRLGGSTIQLGSISGAGTLSGQEKLPADGGVGNVLYNIGGNHTDSTFTGSIIDAFSTTNPTCLLKTGNGRLTLAGNLAFTGTNTVAAGTLLINGTAKPSLTTVYANATLGGSGVITNGVNMKSGGILSPGAQGNGSLGTLTIVGNLTNTTPTLNFDLSSSPSGANDRINLTGALVMSGVQNYFFNLADNALGAGTYNLIEGASSGSLSGVTFSHNLPSNTRQTFALDYAIGNPSWNRLTVTGSAASLVWRGTNGVSWDTSTVNWANGSAADQFYNLDSVTFDDTGANPSTVTLATTLTPAAITINSAQNYTFSGGALAGTGPLTKLGASTLTIANANPSYSGAINLFSGTLAAAAGSALGNGPMTISNGATFTLPSGAPSVFFGGNVVVPANSSANISSGALANGLSGNLFSGNSASVINLTGSGVSFSGKTSAQFDNFTGILNIQPSATLRYSEDSSGNTFGSLAPVLVVNGTLQPRDAGNTVQIGSFSGAGILAGANGNYKTGDTLYVIGGNNSDSIFSGNISSNSAVAGSDVAVTKLGTGMLTLSGSSTFGGGTTVSAGTLRVNNTTGTGTGTGDLEVFSSAKLTGTGIIGSATTIDGGATLAPGDPTGTLTFTSSLALNDSSILQFALGTNSDSVVVASDLILTGQLQVTNAAGFGPGAYPLFTYGTLAFGNLVIASSPSGYNNSLSTNTPGVVYLIVAPITPPVFGNVSLSAGNLTLSGSNGVPLGNYFVQQSSNLVNWISLATNQFDANGGFNFSTNAPAGAPQNFFRLQLP